MWSEVGGEAGAGGGGGLHIPNSNTMQPLHHPVVQISAPKNGIGLSLRIGKTLAYGPKWGQYVIFWSINISAIF